MISLNDGIKYAGYGGVLYFLIKSIAKDNIDNKQLICLVIGIVIITIFLMQAKCKKVEGYQVTDPPIVDSIYPGPVNTETRSARLLPMPKSIDYVDEDIKDFKDIAGIDKKTYEELIINENNAMNKIRMGYKDEMVFTTSHPFNTVPLGTQLYGYTYLPPENWFRAYERPPVCVTDKRCPVNPTLDASTSGLMEFDTSNNIVGPAGIDLRYVKKILNQDKK